MSLLIVTGACSSETDTALTRPPPATDFGAQPGDTGTSMAEVPATEVPPVTDTTVPPPPPIALRADGVGVAGFGQPEDVAVAAITAALGPPSLTGDWHGDPGGFQARPYRIVAWGGFWITIFENEHGRYFASWRFTGQSAQALPAGSRSPALATPDGIAVGQVFGDVSPKLGAAAVVSGEGASGYRVSRPEGPLYVWFDPPNGPGGSPGPRAVVVVLDAGDANAAHPI